MNPTQNSLAATLAYLIDAYQTEQHRVLDKAAQLLHHIKGRNQRQIARDLQISRSTLARIAAWAENKGLIERQTKNHGIGYQLIPRLTPHGIKAVNAVKKNGTRQLNRFQQVREWAKAKQERARLTAARSLATATREKKWDAHAPLVQNKNYQSSRPEPAGPKTERKTGAGLAAIAAIRHILSTKGGEKHVYKERTAQASAQQPEPVTTAKGQTENVDARPA